MIDLPNNDMPVRARPSSRLHCLRLLAAALAAVGLGAIAARTYNDNLRSMGEWNRHEASPATNGIEKEPGVPERGMGRGTPGVRQVRATGTPGEAAETRIRRRTYDCKGFPLFFSHGNLPKTLSERR